jgi:ubiquinone/menaquinone biosynthesis C-methylase UbiE
MPEQPLSELLAAQAWARDFSGWDLSVLDIANLGEPIPWDYEALARDELVRAGSAVDLGTGGGEVLLRIAKGASKRVTAAEQWRPNARLAYSRLKQANIDLVWCEAEAMRMPFRDGAFELVLDRHEALTPSEVDRVLAPGGVVLTQQVTPDTWPELKRYFDRATHFPDHFNGYREEFKAMGYAVEQQKHEFTVAFATLAELVKMLTVAPWYVPEFDVERDIEALRALEHDLDGPAGIELIEGRYLLRGVKAGA